MGFADYKKARQLILEKTLEQNEKDSQPESNGFEKDPDDWYPRVDKTGNGTAIIRLLPPLESEGVPIVKWFSHSFKNEATDRWYINNSLRTFGEKVPDPVASFNKKLWNSTDQEDSPARKQASAQKRKINYRVNIYVVDDPINPENNGKIKKWKFGKTFHDIISLALNPPKIEGSTYNEPRLDVYDLIEGANLMINTFTETKGTKKYPNYSRTRWLQRGPLADEKTMEKIYNELNSDPKWSLKQYIAPDKFKTFEELKERLDFVMGFDTVTGKPIEDSENRSENRSETKPKEKETEVKETAKKEVKKDSSFFQKFADDTDDEIPF